MSDLSTLYRFPSGDRKLPLSYEVVNGCHPAIVRVYVRRGAVCAQTYNAAGQAGPRRECDPSQDVEQSVWHFTATRLTLTHLNTNDSAEVWVTVQAVGH